MTITTDSVAGRTSEHGGLEEAGAPVAWPGGATPGGDDRAAAAEGPKPPAARLTVAAAGLSAAGAAWMVASLFRGGLTPRLTALAGVAVGGVLAWLSATRPRGALLQWAVVPVAAAVGAALVAPDATGGTANLPGLVGDALRSGGLMQPPVVFEAGWRFVLVVLFAVVTSAAVGLSLSAGRARLAVAVPVPVTIAAALLQPEGQELIPSAVAGLLTIAALAVAFGVDTPVADVGTSSRFEVRRLARAGALLVALLVALIAVSRAGFLFPTPDRDEVIPPQRPPTPPAEPDRVLFTVDAPRSVPLRVGVLDAYDGEALLLPPVDPARVVDVDDTTFPTTTRETFAATVVIKDVRGATLPAPAGVVDIDGGGDVEYDPRTAVFRLGSGRAPKNYTYTVHAVVPPDGRSLSDAPPAADGVVAEFTDAPPPPNEVVTLLAGAPPGAFDRLQYVRQALYNAVVAAGAGAPTEVTPARVGAMLRDGTEATPYEITAAEVLLARWAGVPARLGFGFYGGDDVDGAREFRPRHGAAWLEAYFEGHGWVPLVGTPPRAKASVSENEKNDDPAVLATQDLALVVYVPVRLESIELLYETVRYWLATVVPVAAALAALVAGWPGAAKALRRWQRKRWAMGAGLRERILVAYAEYRDRAYDLNVGDPRAAPLEFLDAVEPDVEHEELAWLVTRALWGDLRRDLRVEDAEAAEDMARSVTKRLAGAQTLINRLLAGIARASLLSPYSDEVPNLRFGTRPPSPAPVAISRLARARRTLVRPRSVAFAAAGAALVLSAVLLPARATPSAALPLALPDPLVPETALGHHLRREEQLESNYAKPGPDALVTDGRVFTIRNGSVVAGSLQVAVLREDVDGRDRDVQHSLERVISTGDFRTRRFGTLRVRVLEQAEQTIYVWFPPTSNTIEVFVLRADTEGADELVRQVIAHQLGLPDPQREER